MQLPHLPLLTFLVHCIVVPCFLRWKNYNAVVWCPCAQALILLRNRNQLPAVQVLPLFFRLFRCQDKPLRQLLFRHIVAGGCGRGSSVLNSSYYRFIIYTIIRGCMEVYGRHVAGTLALTLFCGFSCRLEQRRGARFLAVLRGLSALDTREVVCLP